MAGEAFLPPVVISVIVSDSAALASMAGLKGEMASTTASLDASAATAGKVRAVGMEVLVYQTSPTVS